MATGRNNPNNKSCGCMKCVEAGNKTELPTGTFPIKNRCPCGLK